jgi:hypothetical protein
VESSRGAHTDCVCPFEGLLETWKLRWPGHDGGGGGHAAHEKEGCFVHGRRKMMGERLLMWEKVIYCNMRCDSMELNIPLLNYKLLIPFGEYEIIAEQV